MSKSRRGEVYYWIKLRQDLMHSKEVKLLMRQPDGGWYFSIYIYLIMLSINSSGRLIQKVGEIEMIYDLTTITQELMFFKIDTIRVAIEILKGLGLLYVDEGVICITNFDLLVGSSTRWADVKRRQREKEKTMELNEGVDNVHQIVPKNVHIEIRDKIYDNYDNYDNVTFPSESLNNDFNTFLKEEWKTNYKNAHALTKYLINSNYIEEGDYENLYAANDFFENYLRTTYEFADLKNHVQYFLLQFRKLSKENKSKIENKLGYLTNAIKKNQRTIEWRNSAEFKDMQKIEQIVDVKLKEDAKYEFPDDEISQELFYKEFYMTYISEEMKRLKSSFNKKCTVIN